MAILTEDKQRAMAIQYCNQYGDEVTAHLTKVLNELMATGNVNGAIMLQIQLMKLVHMIEEKIKGAEITADFDAQSYVDDFLKH